MPIRKFRSIEEMPEYTWLEPGSPELMRAIASVWDFAERAFPRHFPPGVYKHRSIEEAKALKAKWEEDDYRRLVEERARRGQE